MSIISQWIAEFNGFVMTDSSKKKEKAKQICDYVIDLELQIEQLKAEAKAVEQSNNQKFSDLENEMTLKRRTIEQLKREGIGTTTYQRALELEIETLMAENARLSVALKQYGAHIGGCDFVGVCNCGLDAALKEQS